MTISQKQEAIAAECFRKSTKLKNQRAIILHNDNLYNSNKPDIKEIKRILNKYGYSSLSDYLYEEYNLF